eukprot:1161243-Pelagomonas_calceolata.AAC.1
MARLVEGSTDSPNHTQKDCVESDLSAFSLCCCCEASSWAPSLVMLSQTAYAAYIQMYKLPCYGWWGIDNLRKCGGRYPYDDILGEGVEGYWIF